jgi:FkbM family methyltransferase
MTKLFHYLKLVTPPFLTLFIQKLRGTHNQSNKLQPRPNYSLIDSYSQYQEDLILDAIFQKQDGFYVDIGANDPIEFSNTYRFYKKGWRGINIEPQKDRVDLFLKTREGDINLNLGIGKERGQLEFYNLGVHTLSTFDKETAVAHAKRFKTDIIETIVIKVERLETVLSEYLPQGKHIDFMSIDTEGWDMDVLLSNDWNRFRPSIVVIEVGSQLEEIMKFFKNNSYELVYKNSCNYFFKDITTQIS